MVSDPLYFLIKFEIKSIVNSRSFKPYLTVAVSLFHEFKIYFWSCWFKNNSIFFCYICALFIFLDSNCSFFMNSVRCKIFLLVLPCPNLLKRISISLTLRINYVGPKIDFWESLSISRQIIFNLTCFVRPTINMIQTILTIISL